MTIQESLFAKETCFHIGKLVCVGYVSMLVKENMFPKESPFLCLSKKVCFHFSRKKACFHVYTGKPVSISPYESFSYLHKKTCFPGKARFHDYIRKADFCRKARFYTYIKSCFPKKALFMTI